MYMTLNLVLSPNFHKFYYTTHDSDGFAVRACRPKHFLTLFIIVVSMYKIRNKSYNNI